MGIKVTVAGEDGQQEVINAASEEEQQTQVEGEEQESTKTEVEGEEPEDEVVITIGDTPAPEDEQLNQAPEWVKKLRKDHRELQRENKRLKDQQEQQVQAQTKPEPLGEKPTLEGHEYDAPAYEAALEKWYDRKKAADEANARAQSEQESQKKAWDARLNDYKTKKADLKIGDFEEVEAVATEQLSVTQQGIIVKGAKNSATVIYALGKNPDKLKEIAAIKDPVEFSFAVANLENQLKVTNRTKQAPAPERRISGGSKGTGGAVDNELERLRADAAKTGDMTKVLEYNRNKRKASQK